MPSARPPLRFFRREDLEPRVPGASGQLGNGLYLDTDEHAQLEEFCQRFAEHGQYRFSQQPDSLPGHLRMFVAILAALGAVRASREGAGLEVVQGGRLARHVPQILKIYLDRQHVLIDDWNRPGVLREDRLNAIDFVHYLELRRIELEKKSGVFPEPLAERPVAFGIFRALNRRGTSCYLFETNKDWDRLNFIGGKQEPDDGGNFHATLLREISEELGISPARVTLTQLHDDPIISYGLSGNAGSLARYPCVLFGVSVDGDFEIRLKDRWITENTIRQYLNLPDCPIMVNPDYLTFLLSGNPSRLERCPLTTPTVVTSTESTSLEISRKETTGRRIARYARDNKELLAAILTLVAALITVILAL